ncbi:hypothetical protein [Rubrivirga sp.]|uniref:hypothetical protein n=1 Tax=Rubrivirga sp. TaxID=1885344 RepID=UPI003C77AEF1
MPTKPDTVLEADPTDLEVTPPKERTPYMPDNQSMKVLLGALAVGAVVAVALVVLIVTFG